MQFIYPFISFSLQRLVNTYMDIMCLLCSYLILKMLKYECQAEKQQNSVTYQI